MMSVMQNMSGNTILIIMLKCLFTNDDFWKHVKVYLLVNFFVFSSQMDTAVYFLPLLYASLFPLDFGFPYIKIYPLGVQSEMLC